MCQLCLELNGFKRTIIESEFQLVGRKAKDRGRNHNFTNSNKTMEVINGHQYAFNH